MANPRTTFTLPDAARGPTDPKRLTYEPISLEMELDANKVATALGGGAARLTVELTKRSVVAVDGKPVSWEGEDPEWLEKASPKAREFAFRGFARVNRTSNEDDVAFLASEVVESG